MLRILVKSDPGLADVFEEFDALLARDPRRRFPSTFAEERDAVNIALRFAGLDPKHLLEQTDVARDSGALPTFLHSLRETKVTEDQAVMHDSSHVDDWIPLIGHASGATVFTDGSHRLTVMNVNRTDVETAIGVDLVYYSHDFDSFVAVQYKRMTKESDVSDYGYRPIDKTYVSEVERMIATEARFESLDSASLQDYRLHSGPFYFKLVYDHSLDPTSPRLLPGMYIPLDYWRKLIQHPRCKGPKGGTRITYDNAQRHVAPDLFIALVKGGWIGSRAKNSTVIKDMIRESLELNRSVILAKQSRTR